MMVMNLQHPRGISCVSAHVHSRTRIIVLISIAVLCYSFSLQWVFTTLGQPHDVALAQLDAMRVHQYHDVDVSNGTIVGVNDNDDDEYYHNDNDEEEKGHEEEEDLPLDWDWDSYPDGHRPLPAWYLPNPWAGALLFTILSLHVLFLLLCRWFVWFNAAAFYTHADRIIPGCYMLVLPEKHRGNGALCLVTKRIDQSSSSSLSNNIDIEDLEFTFQRQKYEFVPSQKLIDMASSVDKKNVSESGLMEETNRDDGMEPDDGSLVGLGMRNGGVRPIVGPIALPLSSYSSSRGIGSEHEANSLKARFGTNVLSIPQPQFLELYRSQLMSPIVMFQLFCSVLWMLDEYWQYVVFQLVSIFMLELTTVMQRRKTLQTLHGMCPKPFSINVFRSGAWIKLTTQDLLPGDVIELQPKSKSTVISDTTALPSEKAQQRANATAPEATCEDLVPCDCVLIRGSAVVNEATLTGESVPQMKDALPFSEEVRALDMEGIDRVHVLFSGTSMMSVSGGDVGANNRTGLSATPNRGCAAVVLRTGFSSSQGRLLQLVEFSTQNISVDSKETLWALLMLLAFALLAAGYVLKKGLDKGDRTTHELLLKCVIIVTSVVPRHMPVQMALAVNTALMALTKAGIFCTEPFRVPQAGKVSHVLFDKTGTLTSDQLVPAGIINCNPENRDDEESNDVPRDLVPVIQACNEAAITLAACHSLVGVDDVGLVGDPIELAGLCGVGWTYEHKLEESVPGTRSSLLRAMEEIKRKIDLAKERSTENATVKAAAASDIQTYESRLSHLEAQLKSAELRVSTSDIKRVRILRRHHFASHLQRMSATVEVTSSSGDIRSCCLVKGSPEVIRTLLAVDQEPAWFTATYRALSERGMRVLALAYRWTDAVSEREAGDRRSWVESELHLAGFVAFECRIRTDSNTVVRALRYSDHEVAMLTGDAPLTALQVASAVGLCDENPPLILTVTEDCDDEQQRELVWEPARSADSALTSIPFTSPGVRSLGLRHELVVTEAALEAAVIVSRGAIWNEVDAIHVFARMSPHGKARVIRAMQKRHDAHVFMCGDGGNDVGALKQADVGLALLSGYGNANTVKTDNTDAVENNTGDIEIELNRQGAKLAERQTQISKTIAAAVKAKSNELRKRMSTDWLKEELEARTARGESTGALGHMAAMKAISVRFQAEMRAENRRLQLLYGRDIHDVGKKDSDTEKGTGIMDMLSEAEADSGLTMVRPGDASIAAPFTSRSPSVRSVVSLIRQGRCTLLSALQQQQIMMLECIVTAYVLSALSLEGARSSERQMMASSWLIMTASLAFSYSTPVDRMHPVRPIRSLFHPAIFISTLGQAAIHLFCMITAVRMATDVMGEDKLNEVAQFHRKVRLGELAEARAIASGLKVAPEEDAMASFWSMWSAPFMPNLLNTVVFLVQTAQIIAVLFVNYKGRPWMKGIVENHPLFLSVFACIASIAACAWGAFPELNTLIHLYPFPDDEFRWSVMGLIVVSLLGTFLWDRLVTFIFARPVAYAMLEAASTTTLQDLVPVFMSLAKVCGVMLVFWAGDLMTIIMLFLLYRWWKNKNAQSSSP